MKIRNMKKINHRRTLAQKRKMRVRAKLFGTAERPRVSVQRSNKYMSVQVIDDVAQKTLVGVSDINNKKAGTKSESAAAVATKTFEALKKLHITKVIFDRGQYRYHGRVKAVAETLRSLGMEV